MAAGCTSCHNATPGVTGGELDLLSAGIGGRLLGRASNNPGCAEERLIDPERPEASLLLRLVSRERYPAPDGGCQVNPMPLGVLTNPELAMSSFHVDCVDQWVREVAAAHEPVAQVSAPFDPAPAESAVAKAKYLLNGAAPTDTEITTARAADGGLNRDALRGLIDSWMRDGGGSVRPAFESKMRDFLSLTLQQRASPVANNFRYRSQLRPTVGGAPTQIDRTALFASLPRVFQDTALGIVSRDEDFRRVVTTRRWYVTTATLAAIIYADRSDLTNARDAIPREQQFGNFAHLLEGDYSDWRHVRFAQADEASPPDLQYDNTAAFAASVRAVGEDDTLRLRAPRVGFFNTLEFFDNWLTNVDNQFRVTTSQTLIAALDLIFEAGDTTEQPSLAGLAEDHAQEGTACYACHRLLDPMRIQFQRFYTEGHNQARQQAAEDLASFAFHGHVASPLSSMDEFAEALVRHPRFATAWTQKLCMWANSTRCDEGDPEFQRVADTFAAGYDAASSQDDFRFSTLVRELMSSTLITGTEDSRNHQTQEFFVSATRRRHFCQAIDMRAAQVVQERCATEEGLPADFCEPRPSLCNGRLTNLARSLGEEGYGRGTRNLTTPSAPDPFQQRSVQEVCQLAASRMIGGGSQPLSSARGAELATVERFVRLVMGLPRVHPRHQQAHDQLRRTYQLLRAEPACSAQQDPIADNAQVPVDGEFVCGLGMGVTNALRATMTMACSSPDLMGLGL